MSKNPKDEYRRLMEQIREAHRRHAEVWNATYSQTKEAGSAYDAARQEEKILHGFLTTFFCEHLGPLMEPFQAGEPKAIDAVIDFLEVDIPAFRCGYAKEGFYRKLKRISLQPRQVERLRKLAIERCASPDYRREDAELRRLMIHLADGPFVVRIAELGRSENMRVRHKCTLMIRVILAGRKDLRPKKIKTT
jgi:hypothetical protein